jgi:hypothetical protein
MGIASIAAATLVLVLSNERHRVAIDDRAILGWSVAFAVAAVPAYPIFTQDIWLSSAWGRMIASGGNPYHQLFGPPELEGLPLDHFPMPMTYGPLWAVVSGFVMAATGGAPWPAFWILKLILAACWIATLALLALIGRGQPANERALTLAVFGWLPLSVSESIAEAHNDIAMVAPAVLWLRLRLADRPSALYALAASVMFKYVTAPLIAVELILVWMRRRGPLWMVLVRWLGPGLGGLIIFGVFYRSPAFFDGLREMLQWRALRPADAILALGPVLGVATVPIAAMSKFPFLVIAGWQLRRLIAEPGRDRAIRASLAVVCAALFGAVSHIWPWFFIWPLALAAAIPSWALSRFIVGAALAAPFAITFWWIPELEDHKDQAALFIYFAALIWSGATWLASPSGNSDDSERLKNARITDRKERAAENRL